MPTLLLLLLLGIAAGLGRTDAMAQTPPSPPDASTAKAPRAQFGIGFLGGVPIGAFSENVDDAAGFAGHFGVRLGEGPLSLGLEVAYLVYGTESRKVPLSETIPDVLVTVNTDNNIVLVHPRVRVQPHHGRWRPYVDGVLGFNYVYTRTTVDVGLVSDGIPQSIAGTTNLGDFGLSYGGGGGVMIGFGTPPKRARLDLSVRYVGGSEAEYLRRGAIRREAGQVFLDISRSRTDMVTFYVGVAW